MSESMNENIFNSEWKVPINKEQPFEWKGDNSSDYLWNKEVDDFNNQWGGKVAGAAKGAAKGAGKVGQGIQQGFQGVSQGVADTGQDIRRGFQGVSQGVADTGQGIAQGMQGAAKAGADWGQTVGQGIQEGMGATGQAVSGWGQTVGQGVQQGMQGAAQAGSDWADTVGQGIGQAGQTAGQAGADWAGKVGEGVKTAAKTGADTATTWGKETGKMVAGKAKSAFGKSHDEWSVPINKEQPFEWKGENSSKYLWNEDVYKAHTSGTPSDEQVGIPKGKKGAKEADLKPKMLGLEEDFNNSREMGSLTNDPSVKPKMMNDTTKTGKVRKIKKFTIESKNKTAHPRPINTPKGIDVDLITKAIDILSSPPDEVDIADDINVLLKNWEGSGFYDADDDIDNTNWNPAQRSQDNSIATVESEDLESGEADEVEENLADVVGEDARKAVVQNAKKLMTAAKNATQEGIKAAENEAAPPDEEELNGAVIDEDNGEPEVNFDGITVQKQLSLGHGRCPHKNQFDLCDKCGDGEFKAQDTMGNGHPEGPAAHTPNGDIPKEESKELMITSGHAPIVIYPGAHNGKAKKGDHLLKGIKRVTEKVKKNLKDVAEGEIAGEIIEENLNESSMDNLIKALDDVEAQLAAETMDYDGLMKALGSQINQLGTRR